MNGIALVAIGGALGAVCRYLLVSAAMPWLPGLPLGTLLVNVVGSLAIGSYAGWTIFSGYDVEPARLLFQTGFLGAFTTFSAFSLDTFFLYASGEIRAALVNILLNVVLCLLAVALGVWVGMQLRA